jgi:hypothetical protein
MTLFSESLAVSIHLSHVREREEPNSLGEIDRGNFARVNFLDIAS